MSRYQLVIGALVLALISTTPSYPLESYTSPSSNEANSGAAVNSAGDAWGTANNGFTALAWSPELDAGEYAVSRAPDEQGPFVELFRTPLSNGIDLIEDAASTVYCYRVDALDALGNQIKEYLPFCIHWPQGIGLEDNPETETKQLACASPPYDKINSMCLSDREFESQTLSEADVAAFLASHKSFLQGNIADVDGVTISPAHELFSAAQVFRINAKVLLATLEKENSAIRLQIRPSNDTLRTIMGYNPDFCKVPTSGCTIRSQIKSAAAQFRLNMDRLANGSPASGNPPWRVGTTTMSEDPLPVTPAARVIATLYSYTDWVGERWCGKKGVGGNSLYCAVWNRFGFSSSPQPADLTVALSASPQAGPAPLRGVTLSATVGGSAQGTINYTFYCDRADDGLDTRPKPDAKFDHISKNPKVVAGLCKYQKAGTYTAKVIAERGSSAAESRFLIMVGNPAASCFPLLLARNNLSGGSLPIATPSNSVGCASGQYTAGQFIQVTTTPASGWSIGSWTGTQDDTSTSAINSLLMPASSHSVTVNCIQPNTSGAPSITGGSADAITANSATLHASVNANGLLTNVSFEYGTGVPTSFIPTPPQNIGSGQGAVPVSANLAGLNCGATYTYRAVAGNSVGETAGPFQAFTTSPCGSPLSIVTASLPDATPGQPYVAQLTAIGGTGGYTWTLESGSLPVGLSLNSQSGLISGTPAGGAVSSSFRIGVRDSGGHAAFQNLLIMLPQGLFIDSNAPSNFAFAVNVLYDRSSSITYLVSEDGKPPLSWAATGLPPGLQIDQAGGFLFGTPTQPGNFPAEITVSDSAGASGKLSTVLRVVAGTLVITDSTGHTPPNPPSGTVGVGYQFFFLAQGGSNSGYRWSVSTGSLPPGLVGQDGPGCPEFCALKITGTPTQGGTFTFQVTVTDSLGISASLNATIVINIGQPPSITTSKLPIATIGSAYSTQLAATGGTPGYLWSFIGPSPDPGLQFSPSGMLSGTPTLTNDCPTGATDGPGIWVGPGFPTTTFAVKVTDSAGQSSTTNLCLVSYYPLPHITSVNPPFLVTDGQSHTITVTGMNFRNTSIVTLSLTHTTTTFVSPTTLSFPLFPAFAGFGTSPSGGSFGALTLAAKIFQPYTAFGTNSVDFPIFYPPPTVSSVTPVLNNTNQPCRPNVLCQLVVSGGGLVNVTHYLIVETGQSLSRAENPSTPIPWTQVTTTSFAVPAGTYILRVTNDHQNGPDASVDIPFTVQP
jgi:putative Ig domain-containing protein/List-Bact-rpt repeat protein